MAIFITATGTNIGKTIISAMIMAKYAKKFEYKYFKPIQTGAVNDSDLLKVVTLTKLPDKFFLEHEYHFLKPASPHYAAELEFKSIDTIKLVDKFRSMHSEKLIIEGSGGLHVPLNSGSLYIDVLKKVKIPTILVCDTKLGTINHSLLSIESILAKDIPLLGFYMYGEKNELLKNNSYTIQNFSKVKCLGEIFVPEKINDSVGFLPFVDQYFDTSKQIESILQ
jgi:dethiobiotin synthetase